MDFYGFYNMSGRKRQYQNEDLAKNLEDFMRNNLNFPSGAISRETAKGKKSTLYLLFNAKEYIITFSSERDARYVSVHLEHPAEGLPEKLKKDLMDESIFDRLKYLKKGNLARWKELFKRDFVSTSELFYFDSPKPVPTVLLVTRIKEISLSKKGRLSGNFSRSVYNYIVKPFIAGVENPRPNNGEKGRLKQ